MAITVLDDYAVNINPDVILGSTVGDRTLGNPDIEATQGFAIREVRLDDDGDPLEMTWHMFVGLENTDDAEQSLESGQFITRLLGSAGQIAATGIPLKGDGGQGTQISFEAFEKVLVDIAGVRSDEVINRTADRTTVMVYDANTAASGIGPITKATLAANASGIYYVGVIRRVNSDVVTNVTASALRYRTG